MTDNKLSFGCELEWSDIDRRVDIPAELGSWEGPKIAGYAMGSEIDIVNTKGKWRGHGTDPLCVNCPVGGEIHVAPTTNIDAQFLNILSIMSLFDVIGVACPNHGHIHVGISGLKNNLQALKNVFKYIQREEGDLITACCGYSKDEAETVRNSKVDKWVKDYLLVGDGKSINPDIYAKVEAAESVDEILKLLEDVNCTDWFWDKDERVETHSHRTAFNLFNLTKGDTVEFRIFRASIDPVEIYSSLYFAKRFVEEALKGDEGKKVYFILQEGNFRFPKLNFNEELALGWQETRSTKERGSAFKHYTGASKPVSAVDADENMVAVLDLVKMDFKGKTIVH